MTEYKTEVGNTPVSIEVPIDATAIAAAFTTTAALASAWLWKYKIQPIANTLSIGFRTTMESDWKVLGLSYALLEKYRAARCVIYQVHNGTVYTSGTHQWKITITHEVCNPGVSSIKHWSQNQPASSFFNWCPDVLKEGFAYVDADSDVFKNSSNIRHRFFNHGVSSAIFVPLLGASNDEIIGFLSLQWSATEDERFPLKYKKEVFVEEADKLSGFLLPNKSNTLSQLWKIIWKR